MKLPHLGDGRRRKALCPACGGRATVGYIGAHGKCFRCLTGGRDRRDHRDLTGREKDIVLAEFAAWLDLNPDPWQRAIGGLRMFVPDNGRAAWP